MVNEGKNQHDEEACILSKPVEQFCSLPSSQDDLLSCSTWLKGHVQHLTIKHKLFDGGAPISEQANEAVRIPVLLINC